VQRFDRWDRPTRSIYILPRSVAASASRCIAIKGQTTGRSDAESTELHQQTFDIAIRERYRQREPPERNGFSCLLHGFITFIYAQIESDRHAENVFKCGTGPIMWYIRVKYDNSILFVFYFFH
jgi:hypothetical protein